MFFENIFFFFSLLHLINSHLQINLHLTDWISEDNNLQHDCLQIPAHVIKESDPRQIISYCMGEWPSKFQIKQNNHDQKLTFEQLSKQKITSEQLYFWSAPIDLIEQYQYYLNQLLKSKKSSLSTEIFYNCTLPYFGSQCQYILQDYKSYHSSLDEIIHDYYRYNRYNPTLFTCYMHLECNRGPFPSCLDWTEICDGKVDCLDGGYDEEYCWQLETDQSYENLYQLSNRDCISEAYFRDDSRIFKCIPKSDKVEIGNIISNEKDFVVAEPTFAYEDISCVKYNNIIENVYILTSSCDNNRSDILSQAMFSIKPNSLSDECWTALKCTIPRSMQTDSLDLIICDREIVNEIINKTCPNMTYVPAVPVLLGHIYLVYEKKNLITQVGRMPYKPTYFCYNDQFLLIPDDSKKIVLSNNDTCYSFNVGIPPSFMRDIIWMHRIVASLYWWLRKYTISINKNFELLDKSMMYKCMNWPKYISKNRLFDSVIDCYKADDEILLNKTCPNETNANYFKCLSTNECIPTYLVQDIACDCTRSKRDICDDVDVDQSYAHNIVSFQTICDGYEHLSPTEGQNETDETDCEHWPLIHIYNRCDGFWHYLDGSDEMNCDSSPPLLNCSTNNHICVSLKTMELMCLPIEQANDGIIDCLGAADEPALCRNEIHYPNPTFYCGVGDGNYEFCVQSGTICDNLPYCMKDIDEEACKDVDLLGVSRDHGVCDGNYESNGSDVAKVLCRRFSFVYPKWRVYFALDQWSHLIKRHLKEENTLSYQSTTKHHIRWYQQRCHRGINLQIWLDKENNLTKTICLCPPSYYGEICQYQNQRISLTLQFRVTSDSNQIPFIIIVLLIDNTNERIIHSYEQFTYLSLKHCRRKFNIYLLYSTRPKDETKTYFIHIDIYEKITLNYRASFIKSLNFSFLPVHRIHFQIDIPHIIDKHDDCLDRQCQNGKCQKYFNDQNNRTFCQCEHGWSGQSCSVSYISNCSPDSLSLDKLANNRSLCICRLNKMGPRCLINDMTCQNNQTLLCSGKGECISIDEYKTLKKKFICLCSKGFTGDQCEITRKNLIITFDKNIHLPLSIRIHFIEVKIDALPVRTTTFKIVPFGQYSMIVYWSLPFHIVFVELSNKSYYLACQQIIYNQSAIIEKSLNSSDQCLHIEELFNQTIVNFPLRRRIKYYHLPCQANRTELLKCFYDDIHFCLCQQLDQQRVANCFEFDHNINLNCSGQSGCENEGQCFQEQTTCPRVSVCECLQCFYGTRCQLSTSGFSLSLDAILGYHIQPNLNISHQPLAVIISLILTIIIILLGFTNGILSFITFKHESTRDSGCGIYLFSSSIITLLIMIIFFLKFLILLLSQIGSITNRSFLTVQCHSMDFLLRSSLTMDQWLPAFVAIERAFIIIKGVYFDKKKSKSIAKWAIIGLVLTTIVTNIHDPIYRRLFIEDDNDGTEKRLWCIVKYPSAIRIVNLIINTLHLIVPFIINFISAIIIIIMTARQQAKIRKNQNDKNILHEQIQQHKNLLVGPCILIILGIPRLIISFTSGCMKSDSSSWIFLLGYFISLIPPLLTFVLFVLPSTAYKEAFRKAISQYRDIIKRRAL